MLPALLSLMLSHNIDPPSWKYVTPTSNDPFHHAPLRLLPLTTSKPADIQEEATYRGTTRRYAQFHYGNALSTRICVVVDDRGDGKVDLYIDNNRDRIIQNSERLTDGVEWEVSLDAIITVKSTQTRHPRRVLFRYGRASRTLSYATCGYMKGTVQTEDETLDARRVDADGNGLFADEQDKLWINLNGAQEWNPVDHQFPFAPMIQLRDQRYLVYGDTVGERLELKPLFGVGKLSIAEPTLMKGAKVIGLSATVASREGVLATFTSLEKEQQLPPGEYCCVSLKISVQQGDAIWSYLFTLADKNALQWQRLEKDKSLKLDVIGQPRLVAGLTRNEISAGDSLGVQPQLWTGSGLLINIVYYGLDQPFYSTVKSAEIALTQMGKVLASSTSGFA